MKDWKVQVRYHNRLSNWKKSVVGNAQGAVSSPPLYNLFTHNFKVEAGDVTQNFADDNHSAAVSTDLEEIAETLTAAGAEMKMG